MVPKFETCNWFGHAGSNGFFLLFWNTCFEFKDFHTQIETPCPGTTECFLIVNKSNFGIIQPKINIKSILI